MPEEQEPQPERQAVKTTKAIAGGLFLRPTIQWFMGGKDWFNSLTAWGLVCWLTAGAGIDAVCTAELVSVDTCKQLNTILTKAGDVLVVLGVRRAALRRS
jgi:hypothetical protein